MPHEPNAQPDPRTQTPLAVTPHADGPRYAPEPGFEPLTFVDLDENTQNRLIFRDREVAYQLRDSRQLDSYKGRWVAILYGQIAGSGEDLLELRQRVAREHRTHPTRPWLIDVEPDDISLFVSFYS
jgi:hypothetical protein